MEYVYFGRTGIRVSQLCMGTMTFGNEADERESAAMFKRCREVGINFFDCANVYGKKGGAETILGKLISDCRDELVITSKVHGPMGEDINAGGLSRRTIMAAVEASLKRLGTSYIDIYFLHKFDPHTPLEETLRAMNDLVVQGKVRYIGTSNFAAWQVAMGLGISAVHDWAPIHCIQPMYNLVKRQAEVEILPLAQAENIAVVSYNPLGGGLLTGKYGEAIAASESRLGKVAIYRDRYGEDWMLKAAQRFVKYARERGYSPASLAVSWVLAHPGVTAPIIGARNCDQLNETLAATEIEMNDELYSDLAAMTPTPAPAHDRTDDLVPR